MVVKFVALLALVAVAAASDLSSFAYSVADPYTGDFKHQVENRVGNNVQGQYGLLESDGTRRIVDYAAGAGGFNAVVRKDPALIAAAPALAYSSALPIASPLGLTSPLGLASPLGLTSPLGLAKLGGFGYAAPFPYARVW